MPRCFRFAFPLRCPPRAAWILGLALCIAVLAGCESPRDRKVELDDQELRLVNEIVELIRSRVERTRDPARADSILASMPPLYDEEERKALVDRLSEDTPRGAAVLAAVHDSLEALRDRIFPPGTSFGNPSNSGEVSRGRQRTPGSVN